MKWSHDVPPSTRMPWEKSKEQKELYMNPWPIKPLLHEKRGRAAIDIMGKLEPAFLFPLNVGGIEDRATKEIVGTSCYFTFFFLFSLLLTSVSWKSHLLAGDNFTILISMQNEGSKDFLITHSLTIVPNHVLSANVNPGCPQSCIIKN